MDEHPNARLFREMSEGLSSGNFDPMLNALADDVEWHEIGRSEPIRGKEAVIQRWTSSDLSDAKFESRLHDVVANDEHTIALVETTVERNGKTLTYRTAEIAHMRDGKLTARWAFSDDTAAINEFFS